MAKKQPQAKPARKNPAPKGPALHALVIGCDYYLPNSTPQGSYGSLRGCVRDAERVEQFLRDRAGLSDDRLIKLTSTADGPGGPKEPPDRQPTYENIVAAFRTLTARAKKGDHVYVHYSGHGGRCPTIVPKVKGADGLDEGLVPVDIGKPSARYVRDVEVAKVIKDMVDKGLVVTLVLDCCHSGGVTRAVRGDDPVGVRGVDFIDRTPRSDSSLGTPDELAAAVAPAAGSTRGGDARGLAGVAQAGGSLVLAACRPSELAREFPFDGREPQGALTYWFLNAVTQGPGDLTFRAAYDIIRGRIYGQFPAQTPMLFGDPDRPILGGAAVRTAPTATVSAVAPGGKSVTLNTGAAGLVRAGAEFAVYPAGTGDLSDPRQRIAVVRVTAAGPAESAAEVTKASGRAVQVGDRAVGLGVPQKLVRMVRVSRPNGTPPPATDKPLTGVKRALAGQGWVEPTAGDGADFVVTTSDTKMFQICDATGIPIAIRPELKAEAANAQAVVARLVHLARFQAVRGLDNPDPFSPLAGKIIVELFKAPPDYQEGDALPKLTKFPSRGVPRVKSGEWVVVVVTNRSSSQVNVVVLDLDSDWAVGSAHPRELFHPVEAGKVLKLPLRASVARGHKVSRDVLKVIATVDPPPPYELLYLPALDQPIPREGERGAGTRSAGPLAALMGAVAADNPTRALSTGSQVTGGWAVAHAEIEVQEE